MEERLEEEAKRMARLTADAKKKGESKFVSEEARRDVEDRIRAETKVLSELERQAAEMVAERERILKQIEEDEDVKAAEMEASAAALKAKRALVEARLRQEELELKALTESAKQEVSFAHPPRGLQVLCRCWCSITSYPMFGYLTTGANQNGRRSCCNCRNGAASHGNVGKTSRSRSAND